MIVWSYGGGVQSAAIAVLVRQGVLPKPDLSVIADTGRERRTTWEYLRGVVRPYLDPAGVTIEVAGHEWSREDLYSKNGDLVIPAFTAEGKLPTFCSGKWKQEAIMRWLRSRGVESCDMWIGFSVDELHRCSKQRRQWVNTTYPLIDKMVNRAMCYALVAAAGLPKPPKSRCWMCPHMNAEEWMDVRSDQGDWEAAVELDKRIRDNDERGGLYLHSSRMPLEMANIGQTPDSPPLSRNCQDAGCWT